MTNSPELIIMDVGHGNSAILLDTEATTVIDCPPSTILVETLERLGIDTIDNILISHADVDHAGGLPTLLKNVFVRNVYVNPDATKKGVGKGNIWYGVRVALELAEQEGTKIHPSLTSVLSKKISSGQVDIEILSPSASVALGGVGGNDLSGRSLTSNSMSVIIGLTHKDYRVALFPGDMDEIGLDNLLRKQEDVAAPILVFPHHGGKPGDSDCYDFAYKLCKLVKPDLVVFSLSRNRFNNPRDDIVAGVVSAIPNVHIMCTQLSKKCAKLSPLSTFSHLTNFPADGRLSDSCCGGTVLVKIDGKQTKYQPSRAKHRDFISSKTIVPYPKCLVTNKAYMGRKDKKNDNMEIGPAQPQN